MRLLLIHTYARRIDTIIIVIEETKKKKEKRIVTIIQSLVLVIWLQGSNVNEPALFYVFRLVFFCFFFSVMFVFFLYNCMFSTDDLPTYCCVWACARARVHSRARARVHSYTDRI